MLAIHLFRLVIQVLMSYQLRQAGFNEASIDRLIG